MKDAWLMHVGLASQNSSQCAKMRFAEGLAYLSIYDVFGALQAHLLQRIYKA